MGESKRRRELAGSLMPNLASASDVRLEIAYGHFLTAIKQEIRRDPALADLCAKSDLIEEELRRRAAERDKEKAP